MKPIPNIVKLFNFVSANFTCGNDIYQGMHDPAVNWNGFACPYFTYEVACQILEDAADFVFHYDKDDDTFYTVCEHTADRFDYEAVRFGDTRMYPIGAWYWTWQVTERDPGQDARYIMANSSHGNFMFDAETGTVVNTHLDDSFGDLPVCVNVWEWRNTYKTMMPDSIDVLDIGYMTAKGYEEPAHDWRIERQQLKSGTL